MATARGKVAAARGAAVQKGQGTLAAAACGRQQWVNT